MRPTKAIFGIFIVLSKINTLIVNLPISDYAYAHRKTAHNFRERLLVSTEQHEDLQVDKLTAERWLVTNYL